MSKRLEASRARCSLELLPLKLARKLSAIGLPKPYLMLKRPRRCKIRSTFYVIRMKTLSSDMHMSLKILLIETVYLLVTILKIFG